VFPSIQIRNPIKLSLVLLMGAAEILLIAVGLAMDASAVSMAAGASGQARGGRAAFRLSFHFGLFQFMMPVIGWYLGGTLAPLIAGVDHWIAFGLLAFVGGRMIRTGLSRDEASVPADPSRGLTLVALSVATSMDALAIGMSLAMLGVKIWYPSVVIGMVTAGLSLLGLRLGTRLGSRFGRRMGIMGGLLLIAIGLHLIFSLT
jgi:putative Mn2+ efflux pump MntP